MTMKIIAFALAIVAFLFQLLWPWFNLRVKGAESKWDNARIKHIEFTHQVEKEPDNKDAQKWKSWYKTHKENCEAKYKEELREAQIDVFVYSICITIIFFAFLTTP